MSITDADEARVIELILRDVVATLGDGHERMVRHYAQWAREYATDWNDYVDRVVEQVQEEIHDLFIDTVWPQCPLHPHHPLWLHIDHWACTTARVDIAALGALGSPVALTKS